MPPHEVKRLNAEALLMTWRSLQSLYTLGENWNGYRIHAPNRLSIEKGKAWIAKLCCEMREAGHTFWPPHVTADQDGRVVFEWWCGSKHLNVYIPWDSPPDFLLFHADRVNVKETVPDAFEEGLIDAPEDRLRLWGIMERESATSL